MACKNKKERVPMQVAPIFSEKIKQMQKKIRMKGDDISIRDLTENIGTNFEEIEKFITEQEKKAKTDIKINFDRRKL